MKFRCMPWFAIFMLTLAITASVNQEDIPASRVKDIVVNRNFFSAEFGRPGKGRLEISTKKGKKAKPRASPADGH